MFRKHTRWQKPQETTWTIFNFYINSDIVVYNNDFSAAFKAFSNMEYPPARQNASNGYTLPSSTAVQNLFSWHFDSNHGPDYYLQSYEIDDSGTTQSLTVGVTAGKKDVITGNALFTLTYKAQDKVLKGELILLQLL